MADTKVRILMAALRLFSEKGYEAVSVQDIADEIGITKGALYRHYKNKRDIFESILKRMEQRDAVQAMDHGLPDCSFAEIPETYRSVSLDRIIAFSKAMFRYWTEDSFASRFRKMLMLEQFRDPEMGMLFQQYLVSGPVGYLNDLFSGMNQAHPRDAAVSLYAPMFLMYSMFDNADDPAEVTAEMDRILSNLKRNL